MLSTLLYMENLAMRVTVNAAGVHESWYSMCAQLGTRE